MRNFIITVNGKSYEVGVEEVGSKDSATIAPVVSQKENQTVNTTKTNLKGEEVKSPFPGLIKNLLVAEGAQVKKDQPVLVLEAMKMDNDITATKDGTVTFCVSKGANVESNSILFVIA